MIIKENFNSKQFIEDVLDLSFYDWNEHSNGEYSNGRVTCYMNDKDNMFMIYADIQGIDYKEITKAFAQNRILKNAFDSEEDDYICWVWNLDLMNYNVVQDKIMDEIVDALDNIVKTIYSLV